MGAVRRVKQERQQSITSCSLHFPGQDPALGAPDLLRAYNKPHFLCLSTRKVVSLLVPPNFTPKGGPGSRHSPGGVGLGPGSHLLNWQQATSPPPIKSWQLRGLGRALGPSPAAPYPLEDRQWGASVPSTLK